LGRCGVQRFNPVGPCFGLNPCSPAGWEKVLFTQLKKLSADGKLVKVKASYKLGEALKKGPPKPKVDSSPFKVPNPYPLYHTPCHGLSPPALTGTITWALATTPLCRWSTEEGRPKGASREEDPQA
jgi:hypothetical protein